MKRVDLHHFNQLLAQGQTETSGKEQGAPKETHNNRELVYERADVINQ